MLGLGLSIGENDSEDVPVAGVTINQVVNGANRVVNGSNPVVVAR